MFRGLHGDSSAARFDAGAARAQYASLLNTRAANPLYNDTQRLYAEKDSTGFGPPVRLTAVERLGDWDEDEFNDVVLPVAIIDVKSEDATFNTAYKNLYIDGKGLYCLYLSRIPDLSTMNPNDRKFVADIQAYVNGFCSPPLSIPEDRLTIDVRKVTGYNKHTDYPPIARFAHDDKLRPIIIVKCGTAMCEVGPKGGFTYAPPWNGKTYRAGMIKGWHDEQRLAVNPSALKPSNIQAVITPHEDLKKYPTSAHFDCAISGNKVCDDEDDWIPVAYVKLTAPNTDHLSGSKYETAWGMKLDGENIVSLRKKGTSDWTVYDPTTGNVTMEADWEVRVTFKPTVGAVSHKYPTVKVRRTNHPGGIIVGSARFGWDERDETLWISCAMGCCEVIG